MQHIITGRKRVSGSKSINGQLRRAGEIPAIVYGNKKEPVSLSINEREFRKEFSHISESVIIKLKIEGEADKDVLIKKYDFDTVRSHLTHIDFFEIEGGKELHAHVEIVFSGTPEGVRIGGVIEHFAHEIEVSCLPKDLPETITVDISALELGGILHVSDLPALKGVQYLQPADKPILHIITPKAMDLGTTAAPEAEVEAAAAEDAGGEKKDEK